MRYEVTVTGNMTLSLLDENGFKVLGVEMLSQGTMRAGTEGELLARALNDLTILAEYASCQHLQKPLTHVDKMGISPTPWCMKGCPNSMKISLWDCRRKQIASRVYPKSVPVELFNTYAQDMSDAIERLNAWFGPTV